MILIKNSLNNIKKIQEKIYRGFSTIEVILAAALFIIFATGITGVVLQGINLNRLGAEHTIALQYAAEGLEVARSIRNQAYSNISSVNPTPRGISRVGNVWTFLGDGTNNSTDSGRYTRTIKVESVSRDNTPPSGNIVSSGGTADTDTKKITSSVSWNFTTSRPQSLNLVSYLTNWRKLNSPIMMVYSKTTNIPYYRTWDGSTWSAEGAAQTVGRNINFIVLKSARTRNEAILGTLDSNGNIYLQVWNGTAWNTPTLLASVGSANATSRSFDIDYERASDRAVIAYLPTSSSADFAYRVWDGNTLSTATTVTAPPTTGVIKSIDIAQKPISTSNEISLIMYDANSDIYGMLWNGTTWDDMNSGGVEPVWDATASTSTTKKPIAVAYEQVSGRAMFIWARSTATNNFYRIWNGTSLTAATALTIAASSGIGDWVKLVSRPSSNELMYAVQSSTPDLNTRKWSGSAWDTATQHPEHDTGTENASSMNFDIVWETYTANLGKAWILWGNGATVTSRQWSGTAWGTASTLAGSDDTSFIRLKADSDSGAVLAGIYQNFSSAGSARDISERHLTGGSASWTTKNVIWGGATASDPVFFRIDIATP